MKAASIPSWSIIFACSTSSFHSLYLLYVRFRYKLSIREDQMLILDTELRYTILRWIVDINALGVRLVKGYGTYSARFS